MHQRDLARLLVKIAALVIIVGALLDLPASLLRIFSLRVPLGPSGSIEFIGMTFAPVSISLLAGLAMFLWAGLLVDRVLIDAVPDNAPPMDLRPFEEIALTVLGLYVVTAGVAEGVYYWAKWAFQPNIAAILPGNQPAMPPGTIAGLFAGSARLVIGLLLIFGSRGFVAFRRRITKLRPMRSND